MTPSGQREGFIAERNSYIPYLVAAASAGSCDVADVAEHLMGRLSLRVDGRAVVISLRKCQ